MYQLYFGSLFPIHLSRQEDKINNQTMETLSAPHEILSLAGSKRGKYNSFFNSLPPPLSICLMVSRLVGTLQILCQQKLQGNPKNYMLFWW